MKIRKILFPTDFSVPAEKAFKYADHLAASQKADLALLHVVDELHGFTYYDEFLPRTPKEIAEGMANRAHQGLQALVDRVDSSVSTTVAVREGRTWVEICNAAKEEEVDLIVIGSHGRTGLSHVLIGSVAETVVRHASCPVLVVRDPGS